jgi:hypothetical protein
VSRHIHEKKNKKMHLILTGICGANSPWLHGLWVLGADRGDQNGRRGVPLFARFYDLMKGQSHWIGSLTKILSIIYILESLI